MTDKEIVDLYANLPPVMTSDSLLRAYYRPCSSRDNKIGKCVLRYDLTGDRDNCIYCSVRITPTSDI